MIPAANSPWARSPTSMAMTLPGRRSCASSTASIPATGTEQMLWRGLVIVAAALGALVSFMPVPLSADPAAGGGIGPGSYHIAGKAPDGSTYEGDVDIWPLASAKLLYLKVAGKRYQGLALDSGPVLGVAYGLGKPFGLVVYHV